MKKRLCGLLALVLCMMVAGMPVAALAANEDCLMYVSSPAAVYCVETGDLIGVDQNLYFTNNSYYSGGATAYYYYEGYAEQEDSTSDAWDKGEDGSLKNKHQDADSMPEASLWHVIWYNDIDSYDELYVEPVGAEVTINGQTEGIYVSEKILSQRTLANVIVSPSKIIDTFEAAASGKNLEYYEVMNLTKIGDDINAYRPSISGATFLLPMPEDATNIQVLHFMNGEVETIDSDKVEKAGDYLKITTNHFSPFAIAYEFTVGSGDPVDENGAASQPKTGDPAQLALWFTLAGLSLAGMAYTALHRRKRA